MINFELRNAKLCLQYIRHLILKTLISLNRLLLVEIPVTQRYAFLVIVVFILTCVYFDDIKNLNKNNIKKLYYVSFEVSICFVKNREIKHLK